MPASSRTRSISSIAMCSWPGGLVGSRRMRSRVSSTTNGDSGIGANLADRCLLETPSDGCLESWVLGETRVFLEHALRLLAHLTQQLRLFESLHRDIGHAVLPRAHELPHPPDAQVLFRKPEAVADSSHQAETLQCRLRRIVRQQQAMALARSSADPAAELMKL